MHDTKPAFTLIELLVVVTILVLLLALLAPAMERAIYQAELAVCGSNQRAIASAAVVYATGARRYYPHRPGVNWQGEPQGNGWQMADLARPANWGGIDERPLLSSFLDINATLNDPLAQAVDLTADDPTSFYFAGVNLWFGWQYRNRTEGMRRIGDRIIAPNWKSGGSVIFELLAGDRDQVPFNFVNVDGVQNSHPDRDGVLVPLVLQSGKSPWLDKWTGNTGEGGAAMPTTGSMWITFEKFERGPVDMNYAYQDGSVRRLNDVRWNRFEEERIVAVPYYNTGTNGAAMHVPYP